MSEPCAVETGTNGDRYKAILAKSQKQHRLVAVHWEITYRCNERCTHCYLDVLAPGAKVPGELSTEECKRVIDQLAEEGAMTITFSGGEALIRHDFFEVAGYARSKGFAVRLYTNAILIKPEVADRLAELKPVAIEISVYGADAETHDAITKIPGSFDLTMRAFGLLHERKIRAVAKFPVMRENVGQFFQVRDTMREMGAGFQYDITIVPKHTGDIAPLRHRMTDEQLLWFMRHHLNADNWNLKQYPDDYRFCGIGLNSITIDPYGEIYSCVGARVSAGNVREQPLRTIWRASPVWGELTQLQLVNLPVCYTCELRQFCIRCHGNAAYEDGDFMGCSSVAYREARMRRQVLMEKGAVHGA